jgi:hypothetical protein
MKASRLPEKPTALSLSIKVPQWMLLYALLMSRNRADTVFRSSNAFIISVVSITRLSVHPLFRRNPYCVSENLLLFASHQDMRTFISRSNTLHAHDAMDIGLTLVLSLLGIQNTLYFFQSSGNTLDLEKMSL